MQISDLEKGLINVDAFLDRFTFHETNICADLLSFENLSVLDCGDDDLSLFEEEISEPTTMQDDTTKDDGTLCGACVSQKRYCVLIPCGHIYFCTPCFQKWQSTDTSMFDLLLDDDDNIPIPVDELQPTRCPYCKAEHKHKLTVNINSSQIQ